MDKPAVLDISSERERSYHYAKGDVFTIPSPKALYVIRDENGTTHRVVSDDGRTYRPERGWVGISWLPLEGQPAFVA